MYENNRYGVFHTSSILRRKATAEEELQKKIEEFKEHANNMPSDMEIPSDELSRLAENVRDIQRDIQEMEDCLALRQGEVPLRIFYNPESKTFDLHENCQSTSVFTLDEKTGDIVKVK